MFARLEATGTGLATRYGYRLVETPLFEQAAVFERGIGSVTDVVEKELFRLAPRTEESEAWALRPEPTAGIVRAYIQHGMQTLPQPVKLTMTGPMFRYDRPQAGRYRQFWQFDVEAIGDAGPGGRRRDHRARVTGSTARPASATSRSRSTRSATRPAGPRTSPSSPRTTAATSTRSRPPSWTAWSATPSGCWTPRTRRWPRINEAAPRITDRLCEACAAHFEAVKAHLEALEVPYRVAAGPRPRPRLLHADRVRVLRRRARGPAAGARRRRPVRRPRRAAGRQADARDRVRAGPGPRRAGPGGAGDASRRRSTDRSPSSWARTRTTRLAA